MFENNFNSKKVDPLVEAARQAMVDGQIRRDAIAAVNEEFGVYNRNALVREQVSAYDARIEEAVKCMKEGKPLSKAQKAKMDVDDDNDIDADDLAKLRSMKEGTAEAETNNVVTMDKKSSTPAQTNAATSGPSDAEKSALTSKFKALKEAKKDIAKGGVTAPKDWSMPRGPNKGAVTKAPVPNESILEAVLKNIRAKRMEEDSSFNSAQDSGKSVNEVAVGMPPQITPPAIHGSMKAGVQKATQAAGRIGARFAPTGFRQAAMSAAPTSVTSSGLKGMADTAGKAVSAASKAPGVAGRVAGLAARVAGGPIAGAAMLGGSASAALGKLATGTETGRAIGKSIGQTIRSVERPVSSLPTSKPQTAADVAANKQTAAANLKATGSKYAAGKPHSVSTFAPSAPGTQAKVQSRTTEKGWSDPGAYENRAKSATGTMQQIRQGKVLPQSTQTGKPDTEASTQKFLNKELGRSTPNAQGPEAPAAKPSKPVPTPPSRPTFSSDLPKIDTGPKAGPASTPQSAAAAAAAKPSVPTPPSRPTFSSDLPKVDTGPAPGPASVPNPKVDAPTPPSRPADLPKAEPVQNPDQNRTKVMKEAVIIGDKAYRIV